MVSSYEKISSSINKELFICPADYPYLYKKLIILKFLLEINIIGEQLMNLFLLF